MRVQARITLPGDLRRTIDEARMRWNPEIATGNPAHVTIVYHDEVPDLATLRRRLAAACRGTVPFDMSVGRARRFPPRFGGCSLMWPTQVSTCRRSGTPCLSPVSRVRTIDPVSGSPAETRIVEVFELGG